MTQKYIIIIKYTLFFVILMPSIQATQLYFIFDFFKLNLLLMPTVMGTITGFLVGYYRQKTISTIMELKYIADDLNNQVNIQTKELQEKNNKLEKMAHTDALTGLGNRITLEDSLKKAYEKLGTDYTYFTLMMIDIDYFKNYNDFYGHLQGDEILKTMGKYFLEDSKTSGYNAIRFGGEEFCLIFLNCDKDNANQKAKNIINDIKNMKITHEKSDISDYITISIGIYTTDNSIEDSSPVTALIKADKALYTAKLQGRDRFISF